MKMRFIVWAVVGVTVVVGAIFLVLSGRTRQKKVTLSDLRFQIQRDEETINELTAKLAQARAVPLPPANAELLNQAEKKLNDARTLIEKAKQSENIRDVDENLKAAHLLMSQCRRLLRAATKPAG